MRSKHILILLSVIAALAAVAVVVSAGNPNIPPGLPERTSSYTLEHIYDHLSTGAAGAQITFTEPIRRPAVGTMRTLDEIYDLAGKRAFVSRTGQVFSDTVGDDGDLEWGVAWPLVRFTDNDDGTVTDNLTGLIWLKNANCANATRNWSTALFDIKQLNTNGQMNGNNCGDVNYQKDWRLPNVRELQSLIDYGKYNPALLSGHPFTGVQSRYWSSTTFAGTATANLAWAVFPSNGGVNFVNKMCVLYVWPVRGGQ